MAEEQSIYAQHESADDRSNLHSMAIGMSSSSYTPPNWNSQVPFLEYSANNQPTSTRALVHQASPKHIKAVTTEQHWMSPDHYSRPAPHVSGDFGHSSRSVTPPQGPASQLSSSPEYRTQPGLNPRREFDKRTASHGLTHRELLAYGQVAKSAPEEAQPARPEHWKRASAQLRPSRWQQARNYRRKVYEPPHLDPEVDDSIANVETNAEFWVDQIIISMTNTKDVKDTATSHHRRLFSSETIDPLLIEACSREIFTALIDRCKHGFRGPPAFNKALKASHQLELDRTATCEERLRNVVKVLSWNKRACKDVLYEDWKINLLVNHPLSYDKEKDSQKGSNDQRRRRQLAAQEKMAKTEEELRAYREAHQDAIRDSTTDLQYNDNGFLWEKAVAPEWLLHKPDRSLGRDEFGSTTGKRLYEETEGGSAKRQHV